MGPGRSSLRPRPEPNYFDLETGQRLSVKVMSWVWDHSRSRKNDRLVLLAIADCASDDGSNAYPSVPELMRKTGLSERGVQTAVAKLVEAKELFVAANDGPRGRNRYRVIMATPQDLPPAESAGEGANSAPRNSCPPQETTPDPAESAPGTVREPSGKNSPTGSSTRERTRGTRIPADFPITEPMRTYARHYAAESLGREPAERFDPWLDRQHMDFVDYWHEKSGAAAVKRDWMRAWQRWMRKQIDDSAARAPAGHGPGNGIAVRDGPRPSTTDQRVAAGLALAEDLRRRRESS